MEWVWEQIDESRSGSSGDISKFFRNEELKRPGIFGASPPRPDATLMAREVIQNAWDAAHDLRETGGATPDFEIGFDFVALSGDEKSALVEELRLRSLKQRAAGPDWRTLGLPEDSVLSDLSQDPLRVLVIREHGASGMYGPWEGAKSRMYKALVSIGITEKRTGAGGSYGYGKAGLIRGSATRSIVAYSCFQEQDDEPGVTRRLLGMTYWGPHEIEDGVTFNGFARFGDIVDDGVVRPFENEDADEVAGRLGLQSRSPSDAEDLGTTFLVLDPTVQPDELNRAIERNWWPALVSDRTFGVVISDYDGTQRFPRPKQSHELGAFIRAFEIATMPTELTEVEHRVPFQKATDIGDRELGTLGLVGDPPGWSYPSSEDDVDHRSLVALVRGPRMVVEYLEAGYARPFVRGTFVAHHDVDDLLRQTEPKGHDAWQTTIGDDSIDPLGPEAARTIIRRIKANLNAFRNRLKPPTPDRREIRLPTLERLFRLVVEDEGSRHRSPPPASPRMVAISIIDQTPEVAPGTDGLIRLRVRAGYHLSDHYERGDHAEVWLRLRYKFLEDDRAGQECPLHVALPDGYKQAEDGRLLGELGRDEMIVEAVSEPYSPDWTGRLTVEGGLLEDNENE